jgi:hypothetical protein
MNAYFHLLSISYANSFDHQFVASKYHVTQRFIRVYLGTLTACEVFRLIEPAPAYQPHAGMLGYLSLNEAAC